MEKPLPLRARKKDATRRSLLAAANRRFHVAGFEATTIDEVCQDVGVARRTFFRYSGQGTLAFPHRTSASAVLELLARPRRRAPFPALRRIARTSPRINAEPARCCKQRWSDRAACWA